MIQNERERCWVRHKRRSWWNTCPLCGQDVKWVRLWDGSYSPCNDEPVLFSVEKGSKYKVIVKGEIWEDVSLKIPPGKKPQYGRLPHYFTCPVLIKERREWAKANK